MLPQRRHQRPASLLARVQPFQSSRRVPKSTGLRLSESTSEWYHTSKPFFTCKYNLTVMLLVVGWSVLVHPEVEAWMRTLDKKTTACVFAAIDALAEHGPTLKRPLGDTLSGSKVKNLQELRPGSSGRSEVRILFAFDPVRQAILLVAGDKAGAWKRWYERAIPLAELRFAEHVAALEGRDRR